MKKGKKLYEGKAKIIYACAEKNLVIQHFKNVNLIFRRVFK